MESCKECLSLGRELCLLGHYSKCVCHLFCAVLWVLVEGEEAAELLWERSGWLEEAGGLCGRTGAEVRERAAAVPSRVAAGFMSVARSLPWGHGSGASLACSNGTRFPRSERGLLLRAQVSAVPRKARICSLSEDSGSREECGIVAYDWQKQLSVKLQANFWDRRVPRSAYKFALLPLNVMEASFF